MGPAELAAILAPVLVPFVRRAGSEAREQLASRLGSEAAGSVGALWDRVRGRISTSGRESSDALESQITEVLGEDRALLQEARMTAYLVVEGNNNTVQQGGTNINISGGHDIQIGRLSD